jgi:hypothetical protein
MALVSAQNQNGTGDTSGERRNPAVLIPNATKKARAIHCRSMSLYRNLYLKTSTATPAKNQIHTTGEK